jgi:hypothetical protein
MARYRDDLPVATNLFEAAVWHKAIKVTCRCGHAATFDPHGLWWYFEQRMWDMQFATVRSRFACSVCRLTLRRRVRPVSVNPTEGLGEVRLPMPDEREWKRALQRFR